MHTVDWMVRPHDSLCSSPDLEATHVSRDEYQHCDIYFWYDLRDTLYVINEHSSATVYLLSKQLLLPFEYNWIIKWI